MKGEALAVKPKKLTVLSLSGVVLLSISLAGPALGAPWDQDFRGASRIELADSQLQLNRDHHRGRSFTDRRSRRENPSYLYREDQRRALSEGSRERGSLLSDKPASPASPTSSAPPTSPAGVPCRTMTSVETIDTRRALVSQRECIDDSGITHVSPGSRRVIKYYDE
jgi:hypothetical protein